MITEIKSNAPFWVVVNTSTGKVSSASSNSDFADELVLADGWISNKAALGALVAGAPTDPGGDAAVLAHNPAKQTTLALRDIFGIHPLYYVEDRGLIHIASSISALRKSGLRLVPDPVKNWIFVASHYRYFEFPERSSFFVGVQCLRPGEYLRISPDKMEVGRYWNLAPMDLSGQSEREIGEEFLGRLDRSVAERIALADRPAFTLSSGMDSSTVACLAARQIGPPVMVTTGFDVSTEYDESKDVAETARAIGGKWLQLKVTADDVLNMFDKFSVGSDEPCATVTQMLHRIVTERVRDLGYDSLFSGLGGDEASCGEIEEYLYYFADLRRLGMEDRLCQDMAGWIKYHGTPEYPKNMEVLEAFFSKEIDFDVPGRVLLNTPRFCCNFEALSKDVKRSDIPVPQLPNIFPSYLLNKLYQDLFFEAIPCVLRAETANARATGLKTLYPYFDRDVMMQGFSTPLAMRYKNGVTKSVVRTVTEGLLPDSARNNFYKRGWNAPVDKWLRGRMKNEVNEILSNRNVVERGVYDVHTIRKMLDEHVDGQRNHMMFFWQLISYERWHHEMTSAA